MSKTPKPLELKKFYVLLALSKEPLHAYGIHAQVMTDSGSGLYFSFTSLHRILMLLMRRGFVEPYGEHKSGLVVVPRYIITVTGKRLLRMEAAALGVAARLAAVRVP